jgi:hypothetical protein
VQHLPDGLGCVQPHIVHGLVKAGDRPAVHLLVRAVAAVDPHDRCLVSIVIGVGGWPAKSLSPVGSESLVVLGMESMAERVTDYLVRHHSGMPRLGQAKQTLAAASGLIHALHVPKDARGGVGTLQLRGGRVAEAVQADGQV